MFTTCLLLAVGVCAAGAASASAALPEFVGPTPLPFSSTLNATTLEVSGAGPRVNCTGGVDSGQITGAKTLTVTITLNGCMLNGIPCGTAAGGNVETTLLTGTLGYINAAKKQVGLDLSQPTGAPFMAFVCGEDLPFVVQGSVIGRITPVNVNVAPPKHFTLKFKQAKGKQKPTMLEGAPKDVLETSFNGGPFVESGLGVTDVLHFAAPLLIAA